MSATVTLERMDRLRLRAYELLVSVPFIAWAAWQATHHAGELAMPVLLAWAASIAIVDLLPVLTTGSLHFSLSFPLQLAVAILYPPFVAGAVAFVGTSDIREVRRELSVSKAVFIRSQMAVSVVVESLVFRSISTLHSPWYRLGGGVILATVAGYALNVLLVAAYKQLETGQPVPDVIRQMHIGIFGEFVLSYIGLALFGVIIASFYVKDGLWSIAVFVAPLAFARQMFARTVSLKEAGEELAVRQREKEHQALHDALTGLPNRTLFAERVEEAVAASRDGSGVAVMIMDLDEFKEINDSLGHQYGDMLLVAIAPRLRAAVRSGDTVARLGGDEFGVVLAGVGDVSLAVEAARRLQSSLEEPVVVEGMALSVSASIGIAIYPTHSTDVDSLIRRADVAMYAAKGTAGGFEVYAPEGDVHSRDRVALIGQLRTALDQDQFVLHFQPKADFADGSIRSMEALLRWRHPERGLILPDDFVPLAERTVLLRPLTLRVLDLALEACSEWERSGLKLGVAVNVSPRSLLDLELPSQIARRLAKWRLPASRLQIELTESVLMEESIRSMEVIGALSAVGVGLSIDDFGTGFSSLGYLRRLPVSEIKIDKSFVIGMAESANDATIVKATIDLGHNLGMRVVAEGIEDQATWHRLRELGCDVAQGFFLSQPLDAPSTAAWLEERATDHLDINLARRPVLTLPDALQQA